MKKKILLILLCMAAALACAIGLTACGGDNKNKESQGGGNSDNIICEHTYYVDEDNWYWGNELYEDANCVSPAKYYAICIECGDRGYIVEHGEPNRYYHDYSAKIPEDKYLYEAATCYSKAKFYYACSRCGKSEYSSWSVFEYGELGDHKFNEDRLWSEYCAEEATCTTPAKYYYSCEWCYKHGTETFEYGEPNTTSYYAHDFIEKIPEDKYLYEAATCYSKAVYYYACSRCGESSDWSSYTYEYGEYADHKFNRKSTWDGLLVEKATCITPAIYYYSCEWCAEYGTETWEDEPLGHNWGEWEITSKATVDRDGIKARHCRRGWWEDHDYVYCDGFEEDSIPQLVPTEGLLFELSYYQDYYSCVGLASYCDETEIIIPSTYRHLPVTQIGTDSGKSGFKSAVSIILPDSVTTIAANAFKDCTLLEEITFGANMENVYEDAFDGCDKLLEYENSIFYVNNWVVDCYTSVTNINLRSDTAGLCVGAFKNCYNLTSVVIGDKVRIIPSEAFYYCIELTDITIGSNIEEIGSNAFYNCTKISTVRFKGNVEDWLNITNLYLLMRQGTSKKLYIDGSELKYLTIPEGVTEIGSYAFYKCDGIVSITIPDSVKSIWACAFDGCNPTDVYFNGSMTDWLTLEVWDNAILGSFQNFYIDGNKVEGTVVIPDDITTIRSYAFWNCIGITKVTIQGSSLRNISEYAFAGCANIGAISVEDVQNWCTISGVDNLTRAGKATKDFSSSSVRISGTYVVAYAFYGCNITSVYFESTVTSIGYRAFVNTSLTSVSFGDSSSVWYMYDAYGVRANDMPTKASSITASVLKSYQYAWRQS